MDRSARLVVLLNKFYDLYARVFRKRSVPDGDFLYRRIPADWQKGPTEISSAAFTDSEMSVDLSSLTSPEKSWRRARNSEFGLARIPVAIMCKAPIPQEVKHWPVISNWAHSLVLGKKTPGPMRKFFKENAEIVIPTSKFRQEQNRQTDSNH